MTEMMIDSAPLQQALADPEVQQRVAVYRLLASLLRDVPSPELLRQIAALEQGDTASPVADGADEWQLLGLAARSSTPAQVDDEFHQLFIGLGRGELVPYGSWYQTGYLMEQPLSRLRDDLARLGFERDESVHEPEDHVAALLEVMSMLIESAEPLTLQLDFYRRHLGSWLMSFFEDLEQARSAVFYRAVARVGRRFVAFEEQQYST